MSRASTAAPPDSRPGVGGLGGTDTGEQILLPEEPFPIAAPLSEFDGARAVRAAAGDKQFHIALFNVGSVVALHSNGIKQSFSKKELRLLFPVMFNFIPISPLVVFYSITICLSFVNKYYL